MTACVAEARDVGEGERERGKKERGLGQRMSGEWDREGARQVLVAGVPSPSSSRFFLPTSSTLTPAT